MSNIEIARRTEHEILQWLLRFGWLTTKQIAALLHDAERHKSFDIALRWTQTTLKRMHGKHWIASVKEPFREARHAIAAKGCREIGVSIAYAKDALRYDSAHREACNWMAIRFELTCRVNPGWEMWTEQEIQRNLAPFKAYAEKMPDVLLLTNKGFVWVEVETCRRSQKDVEKLLNWLTTAVGRYEYSKEKRQFTVAAQDVRGVPIHQVLIVLETDTAAKLRERLESLATRKAATQNGFNTLNKLNLLRIPPGTQHTLLRFAQKEGFRGWYPLPNDIEPTKKPIGPLEQKYRKRLQRMAWE